MLTNAPKFPRVCATGGGGGGGGIGEDETKHGDEKFEKEKHRERGQGSIGHKHSAQQTLAIAASRRSSGFSITEEEAYEPTPPAYSTKIGLVHVLSNKPVYDDEYYENLAAEKKIEDLIDYLKDNWKLHIEKKPSLVEIDFRTLDMMHHKNAPNAWLSRRARQKQSDYSGFFSNVRKPYEALGTPSLDTPTLIFENLPEQLKIDSMQWYLDLEKREEEERRRNAPLPKAPRHKVKRPKYGKGRIRKGAGGTEAVDKFVHTAAVFQNQCRGSITYTKLLDKWRLQKEDEAANRGSPFGVFRNRAQRNESIFKSADGGTGDKPDEPGKSALQQKRQSTIDDRIYQHQMLHLERMMTAMYEIMKSMLNMKHRHVRSEYKLPLPVVMSLREHSPEAERRRKEIPQQIVERSKGRNASLYKSTMNTAESRKSGGSMSQSAKSRKSGGSMSQSANTNSTAALMAFTTSTTSKLMSPEEKKKYKGTGHAVPTKFEEEDVNEILPLDDPCDRQERRENMQWLRSILNSPSYVDDRPPELKSEKLKKETPEDAVKRNARNDHRYKVFFDRKHLITPTPQWHDVKVEALDFGFGARPAAPGKSLGDFALLDFTGKNQDDLPFTAARPNPDDIPTPKLPNSQSLEIIDADEQSRLNLLAKCPGADDPGPLPREVQRLYYEAGIETTTKDMFRTIMKMKRAFNDTERKIRTYYLNEIEKFEWNTLKRFKTKFAAIQPGPVFEWSIAAMRHAKPHPVSELEEEQADTGFRRTSMWYKHLIQKCRDVGAMKHHGCKAMLLRLHKYCDVDIKSRPSMLNRFCLLVLSLPTTELGTPYFQEAILFLLDRFFGSPKELFYQWLRTRGLPYLI